MSNEYKDWERDKIEDEKKIIEKYPFLSARNNSGEIDKNAKFPMMALEIPDGWYSLFFQMCDDLMPVLKKEHLLSDFYFIQVKEKFNNLVCCPSVSSPKIDKILLKYHEMARFVCAKCGKPAVWETKGYILSFCDACLERSHRHEAKDRLIFQTQFGVSTYKDGKSRTKTILFQKEWDEYLRRCSS